MSSLPVCAVCLNRKPYLHGTPLIDSPEGVKVHSRHCAQELADAKSSWAKDRTTILDSVIRWRSSGNTVPEDIRQCWVALGYITVHQHESTSAASRADLARLRERMSKFEPSAEELAEMRAEFGSGQTVVNVFTGQRTIL